jgi:quercetin dioxygenase-like cupin family protein
MGPVLGVLNDRYAGRITSRRPPRQNTSFRPRRETTGGWEDGGMPDAIPPVDLASLAAAGGHPGARWRLDGEDLQANLVRLGQGDRIQPHRNDEVEVLVVVVAGRGELTLDGQVHQLAPMVVAHLPKGTVRAVAAVDGPLAYLSVHRRRPAGLQLGRHAQRP